MEIIASRQNTVIRRFRRLASENEERIRSGCYLCDGAKMLEEALRSGVPVRTVLWKEKRDERFGRFAGFPEEYCVKTELYDYVSPLRNSPGPLFTVEMPAEQTGPVSSAVILEGIQDPGNVGTILRTADAFGIDAVVLLEGCADLYAPKSVRASMGAVFRQRIHRMNREELPGFCVKNNIPLYGAALRDDAMDLRAYPLSRAAVAVGSEGRGLSQELIALCDALLIIPMNGEAESLNAAMAAGIIMWEMTRNRSSS